MIDFTADDVKAAYEATGLKPISGVWAHRNSTDEIVEACALTAMVTKRLGKETVQRHFDVEGFVKKTLDMNDAEMEGFLSGFDGLNTADENEDLAAFQLGQEVRKVVFPETATEVH